MRKTFVQGKRIQQLHQFKKVKHNFIEDLLNCALTSLFFILMKLKAFRVTQHETPKMVEKLASNNIFSQKFAQHVFNNINGIALRVPGV